MSTNGTTILRRCQIEVSRSDSLMPISSNGSNLKVTTVVGDNTYDNEEYRQAFYGLNQQSEPSPHRPLVPDWKRLPDEAIQAIEVKVDEKLQAALDKDLSNRAITKKPRNTKTKN